MSHNVTVTLIGSRFRIEPWTKVLRDGGIAVTPAEEVQNVTAAVCLGTVAQLPKRLMVVWVRPSPFEDAMTDAHLRIGRRDPQEVSAAFHAAVRGLLLVGQVGEVTRGEGIAVELRTLLATAQVPEPA